MKAPKKKSRNNPNKINQYTPPDPRSQMFLAFYLDPKSESFSNALQSALRAGYTQTYAENITSTMPKWLSESIGDMEMLGRAIKNLSNALDIETKVQAMGAFGPLFEKIVGKKKLKNGKTKKITIRKPIMVTNAKLLDLKINTSKFIAERLDKKRFGKDGSGNPIVVPVQVNINEDREAFA